MFVSRSLGIIGREIVGPVVGISSCRCMGFRIVVSRGIVPMTGRRLIWYSVVVTSSIGIRGRIAMLPLRCISSICYRRSSIGAIAGVSISKRYEMHDENRSFTCMQSHCWLTEMTCLNLVP